MGAFLSGLLGAAGADIEKQSDRRYQEKRQERLDRMKILELAISNPNTDPNAIPQIFGELDDLAKDAGYKSDNKVKDPFTQMGGMVAKIWQRKKQQQQQQGQQQQARADVQSAPGVSSLLPGEMAGVPVPSQQRPFTGVAAQPQQPVANQPQLPSSQTPQIPYFEPRQAGGPVQPPVPRGTPTRPASRFGGMFLTREQQEAAKEAAEARTREAEGKSKLDLYGKERSIDESLNVGAESRHYRQVQDRVAQLKQNPDTKDLSLEDLYAIAQGKAPTSGGKPMKGDVVPDADSPTGFSRIMVDHKGAIVGRTAGVLPPAGWAPSSSTTYRFVPQADGTYKAVQVTSTHSRQIPGMPPTSLHSGAGGGGSAAVNAGGEGQVASGGTANVARPGVTVGQKPPGEGEMAIAHGAQGAMESATRMAKELATLPQQHPWLTGQTMGRIATIGGHLNMIPGDMRQILADKDSVAAFTMGIHRARGRGYADKWAEVIGDPFINPAATKAVVQRIGKIAEAVQKRILSANRYKPTTIEEIERQMDKEGAFDIFDQPPPTGGAGRTSPDMPDMINTPFGPAKRSR